MVFSTEGFLEVNIESWPGWDLNLPPLNSFQKTTIKTTTTIGRNVEDVYRHKMSYFVSLITFMEALICKIVFRHGFKIVIVIAVEIL